MRKKVVFILLCFVLSACNRYSPSNQDVVNSNGGIENIGLLDEFIESVSVNQESKVRVVHYTDEGDPIIHEIVYSDGELMSEVDTREDKFGEQSVTKTVCESITKTDNNHQILYKLEGCDGEEEIRRVLTINKD